MSNSQDQNLTVLENIAKDVLEKLGYQADVGVFSNEKDPTLKVVSINSTENLSVLIGKNGQNIKSLEHVIKLLYFKKILERPAAEVEQAFGKQGQVPEGTDFNKSSISGLGRTVFMVDVNDYRKFRAKQVIEKAIEVASRVITTKKAEALDPMSSYERRLIHVELASYPDLETESIGEEPERRVVIRPLII